MNATENARNLEDELWATLSNLRRLAYTPVELAFLLVALLALRKGLSDANSGKDASMKFADLASAVDVGWALESVLKSNTISELRDDLRWLFGPPGSDDWRPLSLAVHAVASIPSDLVMDPSAGTAALTFLARLAGKELGTILPGPSIQRLMVELADPPQDGRVVDPCCGMGSILVAAGEWGRERGRPLGAIDGSDRQVRSAAVARIALFLAELPGHVESADVLVSPGTRTSGPYDVVLSAPPMSVPSPPHLYIEASQRFRYGAPARFADWLYVQHALSLLSERGVAVILLAHGPLFRSGAEADVRRGLVDADMIESVIALPSGLLAGTNLPCALVVLRRSPSQAQRGSIMIVDVKNVPRAERQPDLPNDISSAVVHAVRKRADAVAGRVRVRTLPKALLAETGYSLLPSRYFQTAPESDVRALSEIAGDLEAARVAEAAGTEHLAKTLEELVAATQPTSAPSVRETASKMGGGL